MHTHTLKNNHISQDYYLRIMRHISQFVVFQIFKYFKKVFNFTFWSKIYCQFNSFKIKFNTNVKTILNKRK